MARYVDIENCGALVDVLVNTLEMCHFKHKAGCIAPDCRDCLYRHFNEFNSSHLIPTADVRPERHGHWVAKEFGDEDYTYTNYFCSECGRKLIGYSFPSDAPYCHCGAKMDEEGQKSEMNDWIEVKSQKPPENQIVQTKIDDEKGLRNETKLIYSNGLWWFPDKSMYVYYTPTHWRFTDGKDGEQNV